MAANITVKIYDINTYSFGRYELAETEAPKPRIDKLNFIKLKSLLQKRKQSLSGQEAQRVTENLCHLFT